MIHTRLLMVVAFFTTATTVGAQAPTADTLRILSGRNAGESRMELVRPSEMRGVMIHSRSILKIGDRVTMETPVELIVPRTQSTLIFRSYLTADTLRIDSVAANENAMRTDFVGTGTVTGHQSTRPTVQINAVSMRVNRNP